MKTYTSEQLKEILKLHQKWLNGEEGGVRAILTDANLSRANLSRAILTDANLSRANLSRAILTYVDLSRVNLTGADLTDANLYGVNLYGANLTRVNLTDANLTDANLYGAKLDEYNICYTKDRLQIGCKNYSFQEWWDFTDKEILAMDGKKALSFWKKNKEMIKKIVESNSTI